MTAYISDRRRVELALPAVMLQRVACILLERGVDDNDQCLDLINSACGEPFEGLCASSRAKLENRVMVLQRQLLAPYENRPVVLVFHMLVLWLNAMLDDGTLTLVEGSAFAGATDDLIARVVKHDDLIDATARSARKNAQKLRRAVEMQGYYAGRSARKVAA
jgi:hypothetical protein